MMRYLLPPPLTPITQLIGVTFFVFLVNWVIAHNVLWLCLALPPC